MESRRKMVYSFNFALRVILLFYCINCFSSSDQNQFINVSFDRIFPESTYEKAYNQVIVIDNLINHFKNLHEKTENSGDDFLNILFDELINLHFLIKLIANEQKISNKYLATDLFFLSRFLNEPYKLFVNQTKNENKINKKITCIDCLFSEAKFKLEILMTRKNYQE